MVGQLNIVCRATEELSRPSIPMKDFINIIINILSDQLIGQFVKSFGMAGNPKESQRNAAQEKNYRKYVFNMKIRFLPDSTFKPGS
jgi:hypothetical protein